MGPQVGMGSHTEIDMCEYRHLFIIIFSLFIVQVEHNVVMRFYATWVPKCHAQLYT